MRRDGMWGRRRLAGWVAAACVIALPTAGAATPVGAAGPGVARPTGLTATPILSVRRLPGWVAQTVSADRLRSALAPVLAQPTLGSAATTSCLVVSQGGRLLHSVNPSLPLIPASNMKLLTATAMLDRLGAAHRITTSVLGAHPVAGVVSGNLYLVGGGDPLLRTADFVAGLGPDQTLYTSLAHLALQVHEAGVRTVTGSVVGDETRYDKRRTVATWLPVYAAEGDVAPLSALEVNNGALPSTSAPTTTGASAVALQAATAADPPVTAAAIFTDLLRAHGVHVAGDPGAGKAPAGLAVLTTIGSAPVGDELAAMLTVSNDTAAELFTKELGYQSTGSGTTAAGAAAIRADLVARGLPVSQLVIRDGSGLDRGDRATCSLLAADLEQLGAGGVVGQGLPIAGRTGTLRLRMRGTPAAGRLRAKTGTLNDVIGLSGFVLPAPGPVIPGSGLGQPVVFSLILDKVPSIDAGRTVADQIGVVLAAYPQPPKLADIKPLP